MSLTNRLCNPTPFLVDWNYDRGVHIKLQPDGFQDLHDVEMSNQFRPGLPGTEAVREEMNQFGIFLKDTSIPYEVQAIDAIKASIEYHETLYNTTANNVRLKAAQIGLNTEEAIEKHLDFMGYVALRNKIAKLRERLKRFEAKTDKTQANRPRHRQYDPKRTLLFLDPPKEFDSEIAMEVFLDENPTMKARQEAFLKQLTAQEAPKRAAKASVEADG